MSILKPFCSTFLFPSPVTIHDARSNIYRMKLSAMNEVKDKSKFRFFIRQVNKIKSSCQVLAINQEQLMHEAGVDTAKVAGERLRDRVLPFESMMFEKNNGEREEENANASKTVSGKYQSISNAMTNYHMCAFRVRRKYFKGLMVPWKSFVFILREVQNVKRWQEKFLQDFGSFFSYVVVSMMFIIAASISVNEASTWALTDDNRLFLEAWRTVDRAYIDKTFNGQSWFRYREYALHSEPMNNREETYMAIKKMLSTLDDPFTRFLEPEKLKSLRSGTQGSLTGVGLSIGYPTGFDVSSTGLVVISASPGGPANKSSIKPGDILLAIDDRSTEDMDIYEAAELLQGTEGSTVMLDIRSGSEIKHIVLRREKITLNPVKSRFCDVAGRGSDNFRVGFIKLTSFNQNSSGALRDAIKSLRGSGVQSFVLDLRDNSGGLFAEGIETAKIWLNKGVIVYICDNRGIRDIYETDGSNATATSEPLVVLVNRGTASASEILAGALKDNKRAVLYGEPTFGKGKIQSVFELFDGSGLAVTVARYETPAHTDIDKVGIIPDHPLPPSFPLDEDSICHCLKNPSSGCSLNTTVLFSR